MSHPWLAAPALLLSIALVLPACSDAQVPTALPKSLQEPTPTRFTASTPLISPTLVDTSTPTAMPAPGAAPKIHQSIPEVVANNAATGDGGNSWGGHQTRIVHTKDGVFTAYTVPGADDLHREWRLAHRQPDGTWAVVAQGVSGREPVNLLASPDGTLNVIGWPDGIATLWFGKPLNGVFNLIASPIPNQLNGNWPYNSAGTDSSGDICVLSSDGGEERVGWFYWACLLRSTGEWITGSSELDFRFCYTYVFPTPEGGLSVVSTRDVRWRALGLQQPAGQFAYVFNAFGLWHTNSIATTQLARIYFAEEKPTAQYPAPRLNAQEDAYLDTKGRMHVIYSLQGASTQGKWVSRQAVIAPSGSVLHDVDLPGTAGQYSRIFQDHKGRFFLLGSSGLLYAMDQEGIHPNTTIALNLAGYQVEYSGFGVSAPRTGTPLSSVVDVVFPSEGGAKWIYFQLDFSDW